MLVRNLLLGFVLLFVAVDGYYHRIRKYYQRGVNGKRKFFYRVSVYEIAEPNPWRQRYSRQLNYNRRQTSARSNEKGPRSDNTRSTTLEYQRRDNVRRTTPVPNNEKGPRNDNRRSGIVDEYQRRDNARSTTAVRNNEKGPRGDNGNSRNLEYQRRDNAQRTTAVRNNEKGSQNENTRSGIVDEYQRRDNARRTTAVRNNEKGPQNENRRSGIVDEYQRQDNARTTAVRNNEKGQRGDNGNSRNLEYQRRDNAQRTTAVRNNEKGPRNDNRRSGIVDEYQRRDNVRRTTAVRNRNNEKGEPNMNKGINVQSRATANRNNEKKSRNDNQIGIQEYQRQGQGSNNRKRSKIQSYQNSIKLKSSIGYKGCKDSGLYCTHWKSIGCCELQFGRTYCAKTCGFCVAISLVCPPSNRFGCCWDGTAAKDRDKSNCPPCKNISYSICSRQSIYKDCDLHEPNTLRTRTLCPQICGACYDYQ